ncbi:MAG: heme exporter protein CcmD [Gammaproteobacteria bacterium]|nr:heme exporter protein CcmD [Gammaproteobacteria bacterium]
MHFESLNDFFAMGGYAFYVWLSYGTAFILLLSLVVISVRKRKSLINDIRSKQVRDQKLKKYREGNQHNESKT